MYTIKNQDKEAGVSLIKLAKEMDTGDIISQTSVDLCDKKYYYHELETLLAGKAVDECEKVLNNFAHFMVIQEKSGSL